MKDKILLSTIIVGIALIATILWNMSVERVQGSVAVSNEYQATTTDANWSTATTRCKDTLINFKTLGSVIVTKTSNATLSIYDATSTIHTDSATTTITTFPLTTVGEYTFDVQLKKGLCVMVDTAVGVASSSVTFR